MTKKIPKNELIVLAQVHCTLDEIASVYSCDSTTIRKRIREHFDMTADAFLRRYQNQGKVSLRKKGFSMALKGDKEMLKFHLKNYANMVDRIDNTISDPNGGPVQVASSMVAVVATPKNAVEAARAYQELIKPRT